jgi:phospholipid/cholesterol/gamma-HCH transport system substrate-binding protein
VKSRGPLVRLLIFLVVAGVFAVMELTTLTGPHTGTTDTYHAIFAGDDGVSGLRVGNPVRVAGVAVGKVTGVELVDAEHAKVTFTANRNQHITTHTYAIVRYANLLGQRYLALSQPNGPGGAALAAGATIPPQRTAPALSLTDLFNGFRPLFSALTPQQVNELSQDIIDVLQGQTDRIADLIARTADLTQNLAGQDRTFRQVVDSLATLLGTVSQHDEQLAGLVTSLHALTSGLHSEGRSILDSLGSVDQLIGSLGSLFDDLNKHSLHRDVSDAASLTRLLAANTQTVGDLVSGFASAFETFSRVSQDGNWLNVYACNVYVITYGDVPITVGQVAQSFLDFLSTVPAVGGLLNSIVDGLGVSGTVQQLLSPLPLIHTPLKLPTGTVGTSDAHTAVCQ